MALQLPFKVKEVGAKIFGPFKTLSKNQLLGLVAFLFILVALPLALAASRQTAYRRSKAFEKPLSSAISFSDHSGYVVAQNSHSITGLSQATFEAWIKYSPYESSGDNQTIISKSFSPPQVIVPYSLQINLKGYLEFLYAIPYEGEWHNTTLTSTQTISPNQWHHIALTFDGLQIKLYADGKSIGEESFQGQIGGNGDNQSGYNVKIGVDCYKSTLGGCGGNIFDYFNGAIDEVRISNVVRYPSDFTPSTQPFEPDSYALLLYHFNNEVQDYSGNSYFGRIYGNAGFIESTAGIIPSPAPTLEPTPTPTPVSTLSKIILNSASGETFGLTCDQICQKEGLECQNIGVDEYGIDGNYFSGIEGICKTYRGFGCRQIMRNNNQMTCGHPTEWTYCHCGGSGPTITPSQAPSPTPTSIPSLNPVSWKTDTVSLEADDFYLIHDSQRVVVPKENVQVHSDPGNANYTTLEVEWPDNGREKRLYVYFRADSRTWWAYEIRTYDSKDLYHPWVYYTGEFFVSSLGKKFSGNFDLKSDSGQTYSGEIHFKNLRLQAFLNQAPPTPTPICKTGVNSFSVYNPCEGGFRNANFTCYDGYSEILGGPTSCKSSETWRTEAEKACKGHSSCPTKTPTPTPTKKITPTPRPTPVPNQQPQITTNKLPGARLNKNYKATVSAKDQDSNDYLTMVAFGLPEGLSLNKCELSSPWYQILSSKKSQNIKCQILGRPKSIGTFNVNLMVVDNFGGQDEKTLPLVVRR